MRKDLVFFAAALALCGPVFGGQSLVLLPGQTSASVTDPNRANSFSWRVEFQMHDWAAPGSSTNIWDLNGLGATAELLPGNTLRFLDKRDTVAPSVCDLPLSGVTNVLVRLQRDATNHRFVCELWNNDGTGYHQSAISINSFGDWSFDGGRFGDQYTSANVGFFRILSGILPDGSKPPVTAVKVLPFRSICWLPTTREPSDRNSVPVDR